jgi:hypothetical protein
MNDDVVPSGGRADLTVPEAELSGFSNWLADTEGLLRERSYTPETVAGLAFSGAFLGDAALAGGVAQRLEAKLRRLEDLLRVRQEAMEALGIVTLLSERGYEGVEAEQVARLRQIMAGWEATYAAREPDTSTTPSATASPGTGGGAGQAAL